MQLSTLLQVRWGLTTMNSMSDLTHVSGSPITAPAVRPLRKSAKQRTEDSSSDLDDVKQQHPPPLSPHPFSSGRFLPCAHGGRKVPVQVCGVSCSRQETQRTSCRYSVPFLHCDFDTHCEEESKSYAEARKNSMQIQQTRQNQSHHLNDIACRINTAMRTPP